MIRNPFLEKQSTTSEGREAGRKTMAETVSKLQGENGVLSK